MASKGRPVDPKPYTVVLYKRPTGKIHTISVFEGVFIDEILNNKMKKPLIENKMEIVELGIGKDFIEKWKKQYKVKNVFK